MADDELNIALGKLLKEPVPIKFLPGKNELRILRDEVQRVEKILGSGRKARLSDRVKAFFVRTKAKIPFENQLELLRGRVKVLEEGWVDALLCPLTEIETAECRFTYSKTRIYLRRVQMMEEATEEGKAAADQAVDMACDAVYEAKQVECSLKKREGGSLVRLYGPTEMSNLDPRIIHEIWVRYQQEFVLTEDEVKKF